MRLYTVSFFGEGDMLDYYKVESILYSDIKDLIERYDYVEFLTGLTSQFEVLAAEVVRTVKKDTGASNSSLILLLPYETDVLRENEDILLRHYDEIEICEASSKVYEKLAEGVRMRYVVQRSDMCMFYSEDTYKKRGFFYRALRFAEKSSKSVRDLYEPQQK